MKFNLKDRISIVTNSKLCNSSDRFLHVVRNLKFKDSQRSKEKRAQFAGRTSQTAAISLDHRYIKYILKQMEERLS